MLSFTIRKQLSPCNSSPWQDAYIFLTLNPSSFHLSWLDVFLLSCLHHKCTVGTKFERLTFTFFVSDWFETWVTTCKILRLLIWRVFILWSLTLKMVQKHVNCSRLESPYCFNLIYSPLKKKIGDRKIYFSTGAIWDRWNDHLSTQWYVSNPKQFNYTKSRGRQATRTKE